MTQEQYIIRRKLNILELGESFCENAHKYHLFDGVWLWFLYALLHLYLKIIGTCDHQAFHNTLFIDP